MLMVLETTLSLKSEKDWKKTQRGETSNPAQAIPEPLSVPFLPDRFNNELTVRMVTWEEVQHGD